LQAHRLTTKQPKAFGSKQAMAEILKKGENVNANTLGAAAPHQAFSDKDKRMSTQIHRKIGVNRKSNVTCQSTSTQTAKIPLNLFEQRRRRHP